MIPILISKLSATLIVIISIGQASSYPWMINDCGVEVFERQTSLDGQVYGHFEIGTFEVGNALTCIVDCFYHKTCMSVVYNQTQCHMYFAHMSTTIPKVSEVAATYVQFQVADFCTLSSVVCGTNGLCINGRQNYSCRCNHGYGGDGYSCEDIDECSTGTHTCDVNAACTNTVGSHTCTCNAMYDGNGQQCTLKKIRGEPCSVDADCIRTNFICSNSSTCDCGLSFSYDITLNECVEKCDTYGTEFTMQSTPYCVSGHNDAKFPITTFSGCSTKCIEASFTCRSFEIWNGYCWLSSVIQSDAPDSWSPWTDCYYYQRHCA